MKKLTTILALFTFTLSAQTFSPSKDASLGYHDNYPTANTNYASAAQLGAYVIVGGQGGFNKNRALISFDVSSIPVGTVIQSAKLNLYAFTGYQAGSTISNGHIGNNECYLKMCTAPWQETTVTWNTQPAASSLNQIELPQSTSSNQDYLDIDVTAMIQYFINNPSMNNGMLFGLIDETINNNLSFQSKDATNPLKRPRLVIQQSSADVSELVEENNINLYPNPTNNFVNIVSEKHFQKVQVFSALGQMMYEFSGQKSMTHEIDVNHFESGVYFVQIENENGSNSTIRFVKN